LSASPSFPDPLRFGRFELQRSVRRLLIDDRPAPLGARAFDLLVALVERPGELVGKNELLDRVWPGLVVEEGNIAVQVNALRKVLGGELIGTVPGRGYCFRGRVEDRLAGAPATAVPRPDLQTRLPRALPVLLGRASDLATLGALVDGHALVSVTGAGGIGKSLLVQHFLDARRRAYRHGVCWVELAGVAEAAALPATVAEALGVPLGGGDPFAALALAVGPLDLLLALDNAEHLRDDVGRLAALLLDAAPALKLVVASQVRLVGFFDAGQVRDFGVPFGWSEDVVKYTPVATPLLFDPLATSVLTDPNNPLTAQGVVVGKTSAFKTSTGIELRFFMPVLNVPFRLIYSFNPSRENVLNNQLQPAKAQTFRFAVGTTF